jgi:hypothetical protein
VTKHNLTVFDEWGLVAQVKLWFQDVKIYGLIKLSAIIEAIFVDQNIVEHIPYVVVAFLFQVGIQV